MDSAWLKAQFLQHPTLTKADLARHLALDPPAISKILSGGRQIKAHEYIAMRTFFGLPNDGEKAAKPMSGAYTIRPLPPQGLQDSKSVQSNERDAWIMPAHLLQTKTQSSPDHIRIFTVQDTAMTPDFMSGEQILVDLSATQPSPPGVFVVSDGIGHILRQCEAVPNSSPQSVKMTARNPQFAPFTVEITKARIVGRVIAKLQWL
jgi:hypothetical protein